MISLEEYERCRVLTEERIAVTPMGLVPIWDIVVSVFAIRGLALTPSTTIALCRKLYYDIMAERG